LKKGQKLQILFKKKQTGKTGIDNFRFCLISSHASLQSSAFYPILILPSKQNLTLKADKGL